jgi:hypothetical protein
MTMTKITITINWTAIHAAASALDRARRSGPNKVIGDDGVFDAFGGSYYGYHYEAAGLNGLHRIQRALNHITQDAWDAIHRAAHNVREAGRRRTEDGYYDQWIELLDDDGEPVLDDDGEPKRTCVRRWSRIVAARKTQQRVEKEIAQAQAAVRTMLAARPLYDLMRETGIVTTEPEQCITAGCGARHINATGLRWLIDQREDTPTTIGQAQAFVVGGIESLRAATATAAMTTPQH